MLNKKIKIGFIPANRGFFSDKLAAKMREQAIAVMKQLGLQVVVPAPGQTKVGCVETRQEAVFTGRLFRDKGVDGIVIGAVNFGDEQGAALTVKEAGLNVPVMIFGCQEEQALTPKMERRDSFCGLLSIADVLRQMGIKYSVPEVPICYPTDQSFGESLERFAAVCRVINGIRNARYGQIGSRPDGFWTCRYNEKSLQELGPTVVSLDLSEAIGAVERMKTTPEVRRAVAAMQKTIDCSAVNKSILEKIARFEIFTRQFIADKGLDGLAVQCWTSIQANLGICACATMGRLDDMGIPSACESDIMGTLSMHALQLAGGSPSCLADWNNLHNDDADLANCWHCGVFPPSWSKGKPKMGCQEILADTVGRAKAMGVVEFVMKDGPVTLCRATQDNTGSTKVVLAEGCVETNAASTFGAYGWVRIPDLRRLYKNVLLRHFPHHVAMNRSEVGNILWEAFGNYLGCDVYTANNTAGQWSPELPFKFEEDMPF